MSSNESLLLFCGILSLMPAIGSLFVYLRNKRNSSIGKEKALLLSTVLFFFVVVIALIPFYCSTEIYKGDNYINRFFTDLYYSCCIFLFDGEYKIVNDFFDNNGDIHYLIKFIYHIYLVILYILAPLLTLSNILLFFRDIWDSVRYSFFSYKPIYAFSELNEKSIILAQDIFESNNGKAKIVFTDVFRKNTEISFELLQKADKLKAICLRRDITSLNICSKRKNVEIFFINENADENLSQSIVITEKLNKKNKKFNVKLFVFNNDKYTSTILESLDYPNLKKDVVEKLGKEEGLEKVDDIFQLRRVDTITQLVWQTIPDMNLYKLAQENDKVISVLIVGMGQYGFAFFKALMWFGQFEGYKLEITVIDKNKSGKKEAKSIIERECPELLAFDKKNVDGEANCDVEFVSGIDVETSSFSQLFDENGKLFERIKRVQSIIVSLGDDDLNIETAIDLRMLYDRILGIKASKQSKIGEDLPRIYSIVCDDKKSGNLPSRCSNDNDLYSVDKPGIDYLINHKEIPYNIEFIGSIKKQYQYKVVYNKDLERDAYNNVHLAWCKLRDQGTENLNVTYWSYEYFRLSSIACFIHRQKVLSNEELKEAIKCVKNEKKNDCDCIGCSTRKKSEHMRWNAYTRTLGYICGKETVHRAKLHEDLKSWNALKEDVKCYDNYYDEEEN